MKSCYNYLPTRVPTITMPRTSTTKPSKSSARLSFKEQRELNDAKLASMAKELDSAERDQEAMVKRVAMLKELTELHVENTKLKGEITKLQRSVPLKHKFVLIKTNSSYHGSSKYIAFDCMPEDRKRKMEGHKLEHPDLEVLMKRSVYSQSRSLWDYLLDQNGEQLKFIGKHEFNLVKGFKESELVRSLGRLYDEHFD